MSSSFVTCLVPTHNRPPFLRRLLRFYSQFPPGVAISVVDSSRPAAAAENVAAINGSSRKLSVGYQHFDLDFIGKCVRALEQVETPFTVFCADDDFLFPDAVRQCTEFMIDNPNYASAMGRTAQINPKLPRWCSRVLRGYSIENEQPFERCRQLATHWFTNFYAVYRTETLLDNFRAAAASTDSSLYYLVPEMLLSQLSALRGRIKVLPTMYSLMERHGTNAGAGMRVGIREQAESQFQRFKECLAGQFVRAGIEGVEAERYIDDQFGFFREPDQAARRRPRSISEVAGHFLDSFREKLVGIWEPNFNRHRRFVRAGDLVGCEPVWHAAVQLMCDFPQGIPAESSTVKRCA